MYAITLCHTLFVDHEHRYVGFALIVWWPGDLDHMSIWIEACATLFISISNLFILTMYYLPPDQTLDYQRPFLSESKRLTQKKKHLNN